jgi:putative DNA methylase
MHEEGIITRRNLPHWYVPGAMHFVTYRLADTIPLSILHDLREQRQAQLRQQPPPGRAPAQHREVTHKRFFLEYDCYLDRSCRIDFLATPAVAAMVRGNLHHHNGSKYHLLAYCIMPNHVHVLLQPREAERPAREVAEPDEAPDAGSPLSVIMHSLKSYTAHEANKILKRSGQFWQHESYDHWVRDEEELERIVSYIAFNPVQANLVRYPHEWFFCSAHDRFLLDGSESAYLPELPSA